MFKEVLMPIFIALVVVAGLIAGFVALLNLKDDGSVVGNQGSEHIIKTICLNGVKYYDGYSTLAPAVDAETLTFIRCEVK